MIQKIGVVGVRNVNFASNKKQNIPERRIADSQALDDGFVRDFLREDIDDGLGVAFKYADSIGAMRYQDKSYYADLILRKKAEGKNTAQKAPKKEIVFDEKPLRELGYSYSNARRQNEVYTGARLTSKPNGVEAAKKAGIKTVISLEGFMNALYREKVEDAGMKFVGLNKIGHGTLHVFSIIKSSCEPELLNKLIERPETWVTQDENGNKLENIDKNIEDLQEYIDILNGEEEDYPLPIYYGCQWGTNRTYVWHLFYDMLKDADRSKPLDEAKVKELQEFKNDVADLFY